MQIPQANQLVRQATAPVRAFKKKMRHITCMADLEAAIARFLHWRHERDELAEKQMTAA